MSKSKRIREVITIRTPVSIEYEDRKGARKYIMEMLRDGAKEIYGYHVEFGGYSTKPQHRKSRVE